MTNIKSTKARHFRGLKKEKKKTFSTGLNRVKARLRKGDSGAGTTLAKEWIGEAWGLQVSWLCWRTESMLESGWKTGVEGETRTAGEGAGLGFIR